MSTTKYANAAAMNKRNEEIGAALAKGRIRPVSNARELEAEQEALKVAYAEALQRESEAARDDAEVKRRVDLARQQKLAEARETRIKKSVAEAAP